MAVSVVTTKRDEGHTRLCYETQAADHSLLKAEAARELMETRTGLTASWVNS